MGKRAAWCDLLHPAAAPAARKVGRPRKGGLRNGTDLFRDALLLRDYALERQRGKTDREAKRLAVLSLREAFPAMRASASTVQRALARFQPSGAPLAFLVPLAPQSAPPILLTGFGPPRKVIAWWGDAPQARPEFPKPKRGRPMKFGRRT